MSEWIKSRYSFSNGNCVEFREENGEVQLRDSKDPDGPVLRFSPEDWDTFIRSVKKGELDRQTQPIPEVELMKRGCCPVPDSLPQEDLVVSVSRGDSGMIECTVDRAPIQVVISAGLLDGIDEAMYACVHIEGSLTPSPCLCGCGLEVTYVGARLIITGTNRIVTYILDTWLCGICAYIGRLIGDVPVKPARSTEEVPLEVDAGDGDA
jgi:Domain of unknown function (DUF397)